MSSPEQIQAELRQQHKEIRRLLGLAVGLAQVVLAGEDGEVALEIAIGEVRRTVLWHNQRELSLLAPLLAGRDEWSPQRVARLLEEHAAEHGVLQDALVGSTREIAARMLALSEDLDAHMAAEERTVLSPAVLRTPPATTA